MRILPLLFSALIFQLLLPLPLEAAPRKPKKKSPITEVESTRGRSVVENFTNLYKGGVDEKLYVQTDKPYYCAGENIWIKGYLLNAITHKSLEFSNYIYVELIEPAGGLVSRVKIKRDSVGFNGYMYIEPSVKSGDYILRGYTKWMSNGDDNYFFKKSVEIVSPIVSDGETSAPQFTPQEQSDQPASAPTSLDYDLQFFPEGGDLLSGVMQQVAFKAVGSDGLSVEVSGAIYDAKGEEVCKIESHHKGMGVATLCASAAEPLYAEVTNPEGRTKRFNLPAAKSQGVALKVVRLGDRFIYQAQSLSPEIMEGAQIIIHSRGEIMAVDSGDVSRAHFVESSKLNSGISVFSLVSSDGKVLSERLVFKKPATSPSVTMESNAKNYMRRSKASFNINVKGSDGSPAQGEFAVSVTDDRSVELDPLDDNILTYLLLNSDVRGYVEEPMYYFADEDQQADRNLDLLMMTQAWRRFDLERVLAGDVPAKRCNYEVSPFVRGYVHGLFGNAARKPKVSILCSDLNYAEMFELDETHMFKINGLDIPDSTSYVLQATGRNGGKTLGLTLDPEYFPEVIYTPLKRKVTTYIPESFVSQSQQKYFYDGGMSLVEMDAVEVVADKYALGHKADKAFATKSSTRSDLEAMSGFRLTDIIQTYPGMKVSSLGVTYRDENAMVRFMVNEGNYEEFTSVDMLMADDLESIDFYYGADAMDFMDASGGVFVLRLRDGSKAMSIERPNMAVVSRLGYQKPVEFYEPAYNDPKIRNRNKPDLRTTIYWNGGLTPDENGDINFDLYTADKATTYTIIIEGVTDEGEICRSEMSVDRTLTY